MYSIRYNELGWDIRKNGAQIHSIKMMKFTLSVKKPYGKIDLFFLDNQKETFTGQTIECDITTFYSNLPNWHIVGKNAKDTKIFYGDQKVRCIQQLIIAQSSNNPIFSIQLIISGVRNGFSIPNVTL
jgi:hypothetical protein